jgi:hypothetical protein
LMFSKLQILRSPTPSGKCGRLGARSLGMTNHK